LKLGEGRAAAGTVVTDGISEGAVWARAEPR